MILNKAMGPLKSGSFFIMRFHGNPYATVLFVDIKRMGGKFILVSIYFIIILNLLFIWLLIEPGFYPSS